MTVTVFNSNSGVEVGIPWTNPANAFNGSTGDYAQYDIPASTGKDTANQLLAQTWDGLLSSGGITKVEIAVYCDVEASANNTVYAKPVIGGSTPGDEYVVSTSTSAGWYYVDITSDSQAPAWDWDDLTNLDVQVYGGNTNGSKARWVRVYVIALRITWEAVASITGPFPTHIRMG